MSHFINVFDSNQAAQELGISRHTLTVWLHRNPEYKPSRRISGDDLLWTPEDIERVKVARSAKAKHGNRYSKPEASPA